MRPTIDVGSVLDALGDELSLVLRAGTSGLANPIDVWRIQKFGLALTGFTQQVRPGRIQIIGSTEADYCADMADTDLRTAFAQACAVPVAAFVITKGLDPPRELLDTAEEAGVPVLTSPETSSVVIGRLQRFLEDRLAPRIRIHGVFLDVYGLGVLLLGDSGIGKSECALDLIQRGHRLVADDVVEVRSLRAHLVGLGPERLRHHMELRGLGIINIKDLFGVAAVAERKEVELVVRLLRWDAGLECERLGIDERHYTLLAHDVPYVELPVASGRNLAILIEVATRNQMLKLKGYHPAKRLVDRLDRDVARRGTEEPDA